MLNLSISSGLKKIFFGVWAMCRQLGSGANQFVLYICIKYNFYEDKR